MLPLGSFDGQLVLQLGQADAWAAPVVLWVLWHVFATTAAKAEVSSRLAGCDDFLLRGSVISKIRTRVFGLLRDFGGVCEFLLRFALDDDERFVLADQHAVVSEQKLERCVQRLGFPARGWVDGHPSVVLRALQLVEQGGDEYVVGGGFICVFDCAEGLDCVVKP